MTEIINADSTSLSKSELEDIQMNLKEPWKNPEEEILNNLDVQQEEGLDSERVEEYREFFGSNEFEEAEHKSMLEILINQFKNLLVVILLIASIISFIFGEIVDGFAIVAVIIINTVIGFYTELKATRSMEALSELTKIKAKVRREGNVKEIIADKLVVGDIIIFEAGDLISADGRLIEASKLQLNESALTGESVPVGKTIDQITEEVTIAERKNIVYKGTAVTRGSGEAVVIATGEDTELGKISSLVQEAEEKATPLTKRLSVLARRLFFLTILIAVIVAISGILSGKEIFLMIETSIALAVAAVPEGLPVVATIGLARGMWRMANKNALINKLSAVETLGSTNVICTDKTGTLTENRMTVTKIITNEEEVEVTGTGLETDGKFKIEGEEIDPAQKSIVSSILKTGILCNNASLQKEKEMKESDFVGEPMEAALLIMGAKAKMWREDLLEELEEVKENSFDPEVKMMATYHKMDEKYYVAVKGAPEAVLESCKQISIKDGEKEITQDIINNFLDKNQELAESGLRILALANKKVESTEAEAYEDLTFLGLVALLDPPREEVKPAIKRCYGAGIEIKMITGDQSATARKVGEIVGITVENDSQIIHGSEIKELEDLNEEERTKILNARIFSRVSPEQKLNLVNIYQNNNNVVAMTGDGVNDAPAVRQADIGVAMGIRGTQVAQEAADMVLRDDNFNTIAYAVEEGRIISNNLRKFVMYLLSCNMSEIMIIFVASILGLPLPITPLQILYLNIVTDVFPALALAVGEGDPNIMDKPPRDPSEPIISKNHWLVTAIFGSILTTVVILAFWIAILSDSGNPAFISTIAFLTLGFTQIWHVFNMRNFGSKFLKNEITQNKFVWFAIFTSLALLIVPLFIPIVADALSMVNPGLFGWLTIIGMSLIPWVIGQLWNSFQKSIDIF